MLQQLAMRNSKLSCKKYCGMLNELYSNTSASYLCEYYVTTFKSDIACIAEDTETQLKLLSKLQSFDIANLIDDDCAEQEKPRRLATCCALLSQSYSYLEKTDLQRSYEYFILSQKFLLSKYI